MKYGDYLKTQDWHNKRKIKLSNKNFCSVCNSKKFIDIHHLNYRNLFDVKMSDLIRLCRTCHFIIHKLFDQNKVFFQNKPIAFYDFSKRNHLSQFAIIKNAIKKERGLGNRNMFYEKNK